jgi:hypothetical protein
MKVARHLEATKQIIDVVTRSCDQLGSFIALLFLFMFMFAVVGQQLFGAASAACMEFGACPAQPEDGPHNRGNFSNFLYSFLMTFEVLTGGNWPNLLFWTAHDTSSWAILWYALWLILGPLILLELFTTIILDTFEVSTCRCLCP